MIISLILWRVVLCLHKIIIIHVIWTEILIVTGMKTKYYFYTNQPQPKKILDVVDILRVDKTQISYSCLYLFQTTLMYA